MKYVFIVNPVSGHKDKEAIFNRIRSAFRLLDDEMIVEETDHSGHAREIATAYATKYGDRCVIVCCGGDGTVHEIANGLAHTETPMMLLPLGTGNDFAKKVYGTKKINVENVIKSFGLYSGKLNYTVEPLDLIDYNGEKCINVMSYGLDTKVETIGRKIAGKIPPLGHQAYNIAVVPVMMQPLRYKVNVELDCVDENGNPYKFHRENMEYALFAICNASYYGGGFCPAPGSKLDDADFLRLIDRMENYLDEGNIFVLAGSTPPDFPLKNYRKLCKTIKRHGCKLIIDAQGDLLLEALQCEPDFVKPNIFELAEAVGDKPSADPEVVVHSARKMLDMGARAVCVSMSQEGAVLVSKDESEALYVNTNPKVYDEGAVGTGDAMVGAIANSMQSGLKFDEMARYAVATARACARLAGTEMASLKKVYEVYETTQVYVL